MPLDILKSYHKTELTTSVTFSVDGATNSMKLHLEEEFEEETVTAEIQTSLEKITLVKTSHKGCQPVYSIREESDSAVSDERQSKMKLASWIAVVGGQLNHVKQMMKKSTRKESISRLSSTTCSC